MIEIWKDIKGFEGYFQVSNLGRVKRLKYKPKTYKLLDEKILEPFTWQSRYLRVDLQYKKDSISHRRATYIHNLVAETFIGERPKGYEIDHINRDYLDNRADNLRYVSRKENQNNIDKEALGKKQSKWLAEKQPCKGRKYVSKDGVSKMIKKEEIEYYLNNGWHFGFDTAKHPKKR